jgi:hypothetical protein
MFQSLQPQVATPNGMKDVQIPLTNYISDEIQELNDRQEKALLCIEDKLHSIIN